MRAGAGILITPNHAAHYDSSALYLAADQLKTPLYFMTAWQVFGMANAWEQFLMQRLGCFSVDRESTDRVAYKRAVSILRQEPFPLVVFPEGDIYHITDRVTPFREGAAAIAISAARRGHRSVVVVPCGIKFRYLNDPTPKLTRLMSELESRLFLRPQPGQPLVERIYRFAEAILALKEIEYLGMSKKGALPERIPHLAHSILTEMEASHCCQNTSKAVPERVKELRQRIIRRLDEIKREPSNSRLADWRTYSQDMDDLFLVMQLYSYPGDYLTENPSVERLAETLDKFEEDVLDRSIPTVHGPRAVDIRFGEPIQLSAGKTTSLLAHALTKQMHGAVQGLIDELNADADPCRPVRELVSA